MIENKIVYVSTIYDTYDNYSVACETSERNDCSLGTLNKAVEKYRNVRPLFHTDRGFPYTWVFH